MEADMTDLPPGLYASLIALAGCAIAGVGAGRRRVSLGLVALGVAVAFSALPYLAWVQYG